MVTLRITDFGGKHTIFQTSESADDFNDRIDQAFNTGNYLIRLSGFLRYDVRNMAKIEEVPQPNEPEEEEPSDDPTEETIVE